MSDTKQIAARLSDGARNMLLHIARVRPMPEYPPKDIGQFNLRELLYADLIARISDTRFVPTDFGRAVAQAANDFQKASD